MAPHLTSFTPNHSPISGAGELVVIGIDFSNVLDYGLCGAVASPSGPMAAVQIAYPLTYISSTELRGTIEIYQYVPGVDFSWYGNFRLMRGHASLHWPYVTTTGQSDNALPFYIARKVTVSAGSNGSVTPSGVRYITDGTDETYTANPALGYQVNQWVLDGSTVQVGGNSYTIHDSDNLDYATAHTLSVSFSLVSSGSITAISPEEGPLEGGTPVVITGTGFTGATGVQFADAGKTVTAINFQLVSNTEIRCKTPAAPHRGTYDVIVVKP
jgi:hypothetical protein